MRKTGEGGPSSLKRRMVAMGLRCRAMGSITKRYLFFIAVLKKALILGTYFTYIVTEH